MQMKLEVFSVNKIGRTEVEVNFKQFGQSFLITRLPCLGLLCLLFPLGFAQNFVNFFLLSPMNFTSS